MNNRQRKKRGNLKNRVMVIVECEVNYREEDFERIRKRIETDLEKKNIIILPNGFKVAAVTACAGSRKIKIERCTA